MPEYDVYDFEKDVIEVSQDIPVLVDFWAEWCQPCRILGPVLEEFARENPKKFKLAKLDTGKFPQIAAEYRISSIPNVKLFVKGEVKAEFLGALPKQAVQKWIDEHVPSEGEKEMEWIKKELATRGFSKSVRKQLSQLIYEEPDLHEARILMAKHIFRNEPAKAREFMDAIQANSPFYMEAQSINTLADVMEMKQNDLEEGLFIEKMWTAISAIKKEDYPEALEQLIDIIMINKKYMDELPRKICVGIFSLLGNDHEISKKYRRRFDMALY